MIAIASAVPPTLIGWPGRAGGGAIGITVPAPRAGDVDGLAVRGDRDREGELPTRIGLPGVLVAVLIGVTVSDAPRRRAVLPSGAIAIASGPSPTRIGLPGVLVAVLIGVTVLEPWLTT